MKPYVIITGGSHGIGRSLTLLLAQKNELSVLIAGRNLEPLKETQSLSTSKIDVVQADIGTVEGRQAVAAALPPHAKVAYIIHNAAVLEGCELKNLALEDWRYQLAVNVEGPLFLTQLLLPHIVNNGRILHISSGFAHMASHGLGVYCITKAALFMAYKCLNTELNKLSIHVGSLRPGIVDTPLQEKLRALPIDVFPALPQFQAFSQEKKLQAPLKIAKFIEWVIFKTDNNKFSAEEWNIADTWHQEHWLKEGVPN